VKAIQDKYRGKGLVYETITGKWRSIAHVVCTTRATPLSRLKYQLRTSFSFKSHETALRMRDAALMLLSNGRCDARQLSGLPLIANVPVAKHTKAVQKLMVEVVSYNANEHVFLCKDDYKQRPGALQPKGKAGSATRVVPFYVSTEQPAQSGSGHSDGKVTVHQFLKVLSTDTCNIMLNAPAGYGKTHLLKSRVWPALKKRYKAKGVMMASSTGTTALALGPGANTIHSLAGVGRGHGSAEKIHQSMPETARKRWRDVQVMLCLACHLMSCMPRNSRLFG
jgi:hypothetical protein